MGIQPHRQRRRSRSKYSQDGSYLKSQEEEGHSDRGGPNSHHAHLAVKRRLINVTLIWSIAQSIHHRFPQHFDSNLSTTTTKTPDTNNGCFQVAFKNTRSSGATFLQTPTRPRNSTACESSHPTPWLPSPASGTSS